jgi:hypothetical protein
MESSPMREADLERAVVSLCGWLGLLVYHTRDSRGSVPGFPDLVIVGRGGVIFRELKSGAGKVTKAQTAWHEALVEAGSNWGVWRPADWYDDGIMHELRALTRARGEA